jgi:hypothetical protein
MKSTPWIKKFYNDKRDYIVKEHQVEIPKVDIETKPPEYELDKKYEVVLVKDENEITGAVSYYWIEESKQKKFSPAFPSIELAQYWMKQNDKS